MFFAVNREREKEVEGRERREKEIER